MKKLFFACFISLTTLLFAEQKVIKISPTKSYGFRVDDNVIESTLNSFIRNGYRIVSITPITQKTGNGSCTTHLIVIIDGGGKELPESVQKELEDLAGAVPREGGIFFQSPFSFGGREEEE